MAKKYRYNVGFSAEGDTEGTIDLTKTEAAIIARAINIKNWSTLTKNEPWSGHFWIDIEHPMEIEQ